MPSYHRTEKFGSEKYITYAAIKQLKNRLEQKEDKSNIVKDFKFFGQTKEEILHMFLQNPSL